MTFTSEEIALHDRSGMRSLIYDFPRQVEKAVEIAEASKIEFPISKIQNIVVCGLGGSAIGGDLLRSCLADEIHVPVAVSRHYFLPEYVNEKSLVIVSSYSGNTEETISSHKDAVKRRAKIFCITSGGAVKRLALQRKESIIEIPGGLPPRAALGFSFFPMLITLSKLGFFKSKKREIFETISLLKEKALMYGKAASQDNRALRIAETLQGKLPVIYSSADRFDAVNVRWRGQISENAKTLAYGHVFPELNHNEIVGWEVLEEVMKKIHIVILRDKEDNERVQHRMDITKEIVRSFADGITEVHSEGKSLLARMFSLLYLGDWVSFYLAILNDIDPTPVKKIDFLKNELAKMG
jgi:glucose/mannose-6-phosphate isomerase